MIKKRGYSPTMYSYKRSGYWNEPTEYQTASYGPRILECIRENEEDMLEALMEAGLSPNACNQHGESLLHITCRCSNVNLFDSLIKHGADVSQTDDHGRTPLHDCCWAAQPSFAIAHELLRRDKFALFLLDAHGSTPLSYITKKNWGQWNFFLEQAIDDLFPHGGKQQGTRLFDMEPNSRKVVDPENALTLEMATKLAMGELDPHEIHHDHEDDDSVHSVVMDSNALRVELEQRRNSFSHLTAW